MLLALTHRSPCWPVLLVAEAREKWRRRTASKECMRFSQVKAGLGRTYEDVQRKHTMQMAAGLSYYFVMSFFPLLIMFAAVVAYLPIHHLFGTALDFMGRFMPKDSMELVKTVLSRLRKNDGATYNAVQASRFV